MKVLGVLIALLLTGCATAPHDTASPTPRGAFHQHLMSPAIARLWEQQPFGADALVAQLDAAHIEKAAVLSVAYAWGDERRAFEDADRRISEENDWTAAEVARYPARLTGFCSVNPLREQATAEVERCLGLPHMRGVKMHFGNSGVDVNNPAHVARLRAVFGAAERRHAAIVVHMRSRTTGPPYGAAQARAFLEQVLPAAPSAMVQVAHLAGSGPGFPADADAAMGVLADAIAADDPRTRNLWFDVTTVVSTDTPAAEAATVARRIRQVGAGRVLFGSDLSIGGNPAPGESWALFAARTPLTPAELRTIAANVPPYAR